MNTCSWRTQHIFFPDVWSFIQSNVSPSGTKTFPVDGVIRRSGSTLLIIDLLAGESQVFPSKGECRKMIQANGVSINKEKVADINAQIGSESFINGKYILAQKGKKNYFIIKIA